MLRHGYGRVWCGVSECAATCGIEWVRVRSHSKVARDQAHGPGASTYKKSRTSTSTHIIFGVKSEVGALERGLTIFRSFGVDLSHIESRPAVTNSGKADYEFFVTTTADPKSIEACIEKLKGETTHITVLDENPSTTNPTWFPRSIGELDKFASRVLDAGEDLQSDHPGFTDEVYRARRKYFAKVAIEYRHGSPVPRVDYTAEEISTWRTIYKKLKDLYPTHACKQFNKVFPLLEANCGYSPDNIPQLEDISKFLHSCTGFRLRPVAGLLSSRDFLAGLAFRVFHSTQYIRHPSKPLYTPEPDVCHELLGHVPLFADKEFAEFSQEIGLASLGASDEDIQRLATCYWFTIEFGLCREDGEVKAYGAGLLSSFGELTYCLSDKPDKKPFDPPVTGATEYPITEYQPTYFVAESFESATKKMREFATTLDRQFNVRYNPYTEHIDTVETAVELRDLALSIRADFSMLCDVLDHKAGVKHV
mmetsp:Transcript_192/g.615  ORF Transcript_192/g.615 Transcript_192/m.615 type:complete len:478 (-) Transcript_192:265-1698(-)